MVIHGNPSMRWLPRLLATVSISIIFSSSLSLFCLVYFYDKPREAWLESLPRPSGSSDSKNHTAPGSDWLLPQTSEPPFGSHLDSWDTSYYVKGEPTELFRDNLRNDTSYITSWCNAGFTNEFMEYINLIYLSILAERVPIMPPFAPHDHISPEAGVIPFGEIFNLTHLRSVLRMPILEWSDIKTLPITSFPQVYSTQSVEPLGCWSTRPEETNDPVRNDNLMRHLGLDPSYTRMPDLIRQSANNRGENHIVFAKVAAAVHPGGPLVKQDDLPIMAESREGLRLKPDTQLTCIDQTYYMTSGAEYYEWRFAWSPAWRFVGRHARFTTTVVDRAEGYLRRTFQLGPTEEMPKFIAVHMRHGDFIDNCYFAGHCLSTVEPFATKIERMKERLLEERGISVSHVIVASDETDRSFWEDISSRGWYRIDHDAERTKERFGEWWPPLVDIVVQSLATGFVGTEDSTFSLVSGRRVADWNNGLYIMVDGRE
ncbi:hypothetical protein CC1G_03260 [Coprinopsis cinerea okayama7|uniref:Uncharacterized protein n=1 Tax=Coprinopsis cinerea (strain Okayama-7 / 130 / ATCC MYA-4618 / FGSC 9003) TaxID=240176 RepID=A8N7B7_COPC7|nr:hypothetical protein CC1G_03260 [Coprinopsis cinerea okayama7\|eukprot:XP_001830723.2 hypothetical protein CC1G_03260 [Coprinopsis cinerea okayama7\